MSFSLKLLRGIVATVFSTFKLWERVASHVNVVCICKHAPFSSPTLTPTVPSLIFCLSLSTCRIHGTTNSMCWGEQWSAVNAKFPFIPIKAADTASGIGGISHERQACRRTMVDPQEVKRPHHGTIGSSCLKSPCARISLLLLQSIPCCEYHI